MHNRCRLLAAGRPILRRISPFRSVNGYGLFRRMTTDRPEIVIEGSDDGVIWSEIEFRFKPGDVSQRPRFVAPHQPRLDWQMWFAALDPRRASGWLRELARHILRGTPEVRDLLGDHPFREQPPRFLRFVSYRYEFTTPEERRAGGDWWKRELVGAAQVVSLEMLEGGGSGRPGR